MSIVFSSGNGKRNWTRRASASINELTEGICLVERDRIEEAIVKLIFSKDPWIERCV